MARRIRQHTHGEKLVPGGREITFDFREAELPPIPAILQLPASAKPVPAVVLLHGLTSSKEVLAGSIGKELLRRGIGGLRSTCPCTAREGPDSRARSSAIRYRWLPGGARRRPRLGSPFAT